MEYTIENARMLDGAIVDVEIANGVIKNIGSGLNSGEILDANKNLLIPGLVDLHTHLREPGREDSETVATGSAAAAKGGFTAISAMANTFPVADTAGVVEQVFRLGREAGLCDVFPIGAVTQRLEGKKLAELGAMANSKAAVRIFSDDGKCVSDPLLMRRALEYVKTFNGIIAQHAQEPALTVGSQMNEGIVSSKLGLAGWPAVAEEAIIARDILLAEHVGSRLHICHLTTAGGVDLVRFAKARGIAVTAEVTPHHLLLTDDLVSNYDPVFKVNPPLRTQDDVNALRKGLADGTIDIVGTDHAPHPTEDKDCEWQSAAFGMVGLETALSVVVKSMVESKLLDWQGVVDRMSIAPARIAGYANHGQKVAIGAPANLTIVNTSANWIVDRNTLASKSKNTPFAGMTLPSQVLHTFLNGELVLKNSMIVKSATGGSN
ncbi:MAG: dihydroorotase [Candidatus Nanopelagicaceae bacterium]